MANPPADSLCADGASGSLTVEDTHSGGGCGPVTVENADTTTPSNCDRSYVLGAGFQAFFDTYGTGMYLIQDAHDPNDHSWTSDDFARVSVDPGFVAELYLLVPGGENAGHSATADDMPNVIDPRGGWVETGETYTEANGITRHLWTKTIDGIYALFHAVAQGWGYVYMVRVRCSSAASVNIDCSMVSQPDVTPTQCYDNVEPNTPLWMDRAYAWTDGPSDMIGGGWTYFRVSLEPQAGAPCASLALAPSPLIFSYNSEKSLCGTGVLIRPTRTRMGARVGSTGTLPAPRRSQFAARITVAAQTLRSTRTCSVPILRAR